jgi:hypothetical protein
MTEPMLASGRNSERIENGRILRWLIATAAAGTSSWNNYDVFTASCPASLEEPKSSPTGAPGQT